MRIFPKGSRSPFSGGHKYSIREISGHHIRDYRNGGLEARIRNDGKIFRPHHNNYSIGTYKNGKFYDRHKREIGHHYGK